MRRLCLLMMLSVLGCWSITLAQDAPLPQFKAIDISAIGIPPVPMDRWGCTAADIDRNGWPDLNNPKWRGGLTSQVYLNHNGIFTEISGIPDRAFE